MTYTAAEVDARVFAFLKTHPNSSQQNVIEGIGRDIYQVKASLLRLTRAGLVWIIKQEYINKRGAHRSRILYTVAEEFQHE